METKIFSDRAVASKWGGKLTFVPRADLDKSSIDVLERLDQRFGSARPQSEKEGWKAGVSGVLSATLTLGLIGFLFFQLKGQFKSLKFLEPAQVHGSIEDLVGMAATLFGLTVTECMASCRTLPHVRAVRGCAMIAT